MLRKNEKSKNLSDIRTFGLSFGGTRLNSRTQLISGVPNRKAACVRIDYVDPGPFRETVRVQMLLL